MLFRPTISARPRCKRVLIGTRGWTSTIAARSSSALGPGCPASRSGGLGSPDRTWQEWQGSAFARVRAGSLARTKILQTNELSERARTGANGRSHLPCRRSWVRVPSSALTKPHEMGLFPWQWLQDQGLEQNRHRCITQRVWRNGVGTAQVRIGVSPNHAHNTGDRRVARRKRRTYRAARLVGSRRLPGSAPRRSRSTLFVALV
jgi:hypothetical protein